jgi:hypothetical protein
MTEQPPSADTDLRAWLADNIALHRSRAQTENFVNQAMEQVERFCEQRVSAETAMLREAVEFAMCWIDGAPQYRAVSNDDRNAALKALRAALDSAPAERPAPPQQPSEADRLGKALCKLQDDYNAVVSALLEVMRYYPTSQDAFPKYAKLVNLDSSAPSALASTCEQPEQNQRERPRPCLGGDSAAGRGAAQAAPAPAINLGERSNTDPQPETGSATPPSSPSYNEWARALLRYSGTSRQELEDSIAAGLRGAVGVAFGAKRPSALVNTTPEQDKFYYWGWKDGQLSAKAAAPPSPAAVVDYTPIDALPTRIWSGEHEAYWRKDAAGYTNRAALAWVLPLAEARERTSHCGPEKKIYLEIAHDQIAALSAVASEHQAAAIRAFGQRVWSDTEEVAYQAGVNDTRARLQEPLLPFLAFRAAYPRPRISVETADTVIASAGQAQITLADLDAIARIEEMLK